MAGQLKVNAVQLGDDATATKNLVIRTNADGTFTLARGNIGATTQDILTIDSNGRIAMPQPMGSRPQAGVSSIRLYGSPGNGSSSSDVRRFSTLDYSVGTDITYADSATAGATFTINTAGVYTISFSAQTNSAVNIGITRNIAGAWAFVGQASVTLAAMSAYAATAGGYVGWTGWLNVGDVIRAHTGNNTVGGSTSVDSFTLTRVA